MSRHLVSALCIGCLISIIRTVPILPPFPHPVQLKSSLSTIYRNPPLGTVNVSISIVKATTLRPKALTSTSGTKVQAGTFGAYLTQIVHPNTLKVWPSHADRVKAEPPLNSIIQRYGSKITTSLGTIPRRGLELLNQVNKFGSTSNKGLMLALRPSPNPSSPSAEGRWQKDVRVRKVTSPKYPTELTLPLKYMARAQTKTNKSFIYTDEPVWKDTRYHFKHQSRQPRLRIESDPMVEYYPEDKLMSTVCQDKSTIVGTDMVTNYIQSHIYKKAYSKRILNNNLRKNSTLDMMLVYCHMPDIVPVKAFLECIIMRHMLMESMIPKYPYHQVQPKL